MEDGGGAGDAEAARHAISPEELGPLWDVFRAGKPAICPRDGGAMAVGVDATAHAYRMICVQCGTASPWFESPATGVRVRTGTSSMPVARPGPTED